MVATYTKKNGIRYHRGYRYIKPDNQHPFVNNDGYIPEHRLIAEKYLLNDSNSVIIDGKRYLTLEFDVHHIDFNRLNNNPQNLIIMTKGEHKALHQKLRIKQHFIEYCNQYNLDYNTTKQTHLDFRNGCFRKCILKYS